MLGPMRRATHLLARAVAVVVLAASFLAPGLLHPVVALEIPRTLARSLDVGAAGRIVFAPFAPTHVAFTWRGDEGSAIRFRTIAPDGTTSAWRRALEDHDATRGATRASGMLRVPHPAAIEWRPLERRTARVGRVRLDYVNTEDGPVRTVYVPATAGAAPGEPRIVTRAEWGADESLKSTSGGCERRFFDVQQLFVHHTAGSNNDPDPYATMRAVYWYHTQSRGWCDLGYNFVIGWDGTIFEGRWARSYAPYETHTSEDAYGNAVAGAHVSNYNSGSVGISLMGNFMRRNPPAAMQQALVDILAWEVDRHGLQARGKHLYRNPESGLTRTLPFIAGHRDAGTTACPGAKLYDLLPSIRKRVEQQIGAGLTSTTLTLSASATKIPYGEEVSFVGALSDEFGSPMPFTPLTIHRREGSGPWTQEIVQTGLDGSFSLRAAPGAKLRVQAEYGGDAGHWGALSPRAVVEVRPLVDLVADGERDASGDYSYPAGTTHALLSGTVEPNKAGGRVVLQIYRVEADGSRTLLRKPALTLDASSAFSYSFRLPGAATYSVRAWFKGDNQHLPSPSEAILLRAG